MMPEEAALLAERDRRSADLDAAIEALGRRIGAVQAEIDRMRSDRARTRTARWAKAIGLPVVIVGAFTWIADAADRTVVQAPFEVVGRNNHPIMRISAFENSNAIELFDQAGAPVVRVVAGAAYAYFSAKGADSTAAELGVDGDVPYLRLHDAAGKERVSLDVTGGKPFVRLKGADGHGLVQLSQGSTGGGELEIAKPGGAVVVRAGIAPNGVGRVEAFPLGNPLGSAILGKIPQ